MILDDRILEIHFKYTDDDNHLYAEVKYEDGTVASYSNQETLEFLWKKFYHQITNFDELGY